MKTEVLNVPEVHCGHCITSIEGAVGEIQGVKEVKVDLGRRDVTVSFDDTAVDLAQIIDAIVAQGYDVGDGPKFVEMGQKP